MKPIPTSPEAQARLAPVVLYGGTFDPPHAGHLAVALKALEATGARRLLWVVGGDPPHKVGTGAPAHHRLAMVQALVAGQPRFEVATWELERPGPSYAVDTLRQARRALALPAAPEAVLWVLGADAAAGLPGWHAAPELAQLAAFLVVTREGFNEGGLRAQLAKEAPWLPAKALSFLNMPPVPASSSELREALAKGETPAHLPDAVAAYVQQHSLYGPAQPEGGHP